MSRMSGRKEDPPRLRPSAGRHRRRGRASSAVASDPEGFASLVESDKYKGWLLDQFGVLHDGVNAYPHAIELVELLHQRGCSLVILTNSARRAPHTFARLETLGFKKEWFAGVATSGDVTHRVLSLPPGEADPTLLPVDHPLWRDLDLPSEAKAGGVPTRKRRCVHLLWKTHDLVNGIDLEALDIDVVEDPDEADFVLVHWFDTMALPKTPEMAAKGEPFPLRKVSEIDVDAILARCAARQIPMLVANPDIVANKGDKLLPMPGSLAVKYNQDLGVPLERIHLLGKPSPIVYNLARQSFLSDIRKEEIIAVGDSLEHDIQGACVFEIDSAFITRGIHCNDLHENEECAIPEDLWCNLEELERLCEEHNADPTVCSEIFGLGQ